MNIEEIEKQLKKRIEEAPFYAWGRKQSNSWDDQTNFIYQVSTWQQFQDKAKSFNPQLYAYAINRWFNFWSACGVEEIFCSLPDVKPTRKRDRLADFSIQNITFDHKTTVFPRGYSFGISHAISNRNHLITWLYQNQSKERRCHYANRLFIVLFSLSGEHWKIKAELSHIKTDIEKYVNSFNSNKLARLTINNHNILSDVIWTVSA